MKKLSVNDALLKAQTHFRSGETDKAKKLYQAILKAFPKNKRAQKELQKIFDIKQNREINSPPKEMVNIIIELYNQGEFQTVIAKSVKLTGLHPKASNIWNILGAASLGLGKTSQAADAFKKVTELNPDLAEGHNNLGSTLHQQGQKTDAINALKRALSLNPSYAEAYYNLGNVLQDKGDLEEAIGAYKKAITFKSNYPVAFNNMGNVLSAQGDLEAAEQAYNNAMALKPDYAACHFNLGNILQKKGSLEPAMSSYNKAITIKSNYVEAWSNGADMLEKWNRLEQLELWLEKACKNFKSLPPELEFLQAKLLWRNKKHREASKIIKGLDPSSINETHKQDYLHLKAKCFEASKDFDNAFTSFLQMNLVAKESKEYLQCNPEKFFQNSRDQLSKLKSGLAIKTSEIILDEPTSSPIFLVGFPRSGTTLLDTILRSHSSIEVAEEPPSVQSAKMVIFNSGHSDIIGTRISPEVLQAARNAYSLELAKHIKNVTPSLVSIDKLPLNLLNIPLILQLHPKAKFILALRHPMDAVLSCWMQNFKLNSAMANMIDLDRLVELYCTAMETFKICQTAYDLNVHMIKYEDLLEDLSGETGALLKFLDLSWEPQMESYRDAALKGGRINTPSYSQVVQPIYKDAKFRWLNYEKYLNKYLHQLEPWFDSFGYRNY